MSKYVEKHKPIIETMINTAALAITAYGTNLILNKDYYGFICVIFGGAIEFFKYEARKRKIW